MYTHVQDIACHENYNRLDWQIQKGPNKAQIGGYLWQKKNFEY